MTSGRPPETQSDPPAAPLTASVVVCAHTEDRWTAICAGMDALARQEPAPHEVLLVVDHHPDLLERARAAFPDVRVVANEHERGLAGGRNTGIERATGSVVAFLDDDARPRPGWLAGFLSAFARPEVQGTGGLIVPDWLTTRPGWFPEEFLWVVGCTYRGASLDEVPIRNPIGASMAFRAEVFGRIGQFTHEHARVGLRPTKNCDETEFAIRLRADAPDAVILNVPGAVVDHEVTAERARLTYFVDRCWNEGKSKALLAREAGAASGLESERAYTREALPRGVRRGVREALRGDLDGLRRSAAIVLGLVTTAAGYVAGCVGAKLARR